MQRVMKPKKIAFGYDFINGNIVKNESEEKIVKEIFKLYIDGKSLKQIAEKMRNISSNEKSTEVNWNKSKIYRILDDKRYLGKNKYPKLIEQETFEKAHSIKQSKNLVKDIDRNKGVYKISDIKCPYCNSLMRRKVDFRKNDLVRWICKNDDCKASLCISDDNLLKKITELLNKVIKNPNLLNEPIEKVDNIKDNYDTFIFDTQENIKKKREKLIDLVAQKYKKIDQNVYLTKRLKDVFMNKGLLEDFDLNFNNETVDEIRIYEDGEIGLVLINKQEITMRGVNGISS